MTRKTRKLLPEAAAGISSPRRRHPAQPVERPIGGRGVRVKRSAPRVRRSPRGAGVIEGRNATARCRSSRRTRTAAAAFVWDPPCASVCSRSTCRSILRGHIPFQQELMVVLQGSQRRVQPARNRRHALSLLRPQLVDVFVQRLTGYSLFWIPSRPAISMAENAR